MLRKLATVFVVGDKEYNKNKMALNKQAIFKFFRQFN